MKIGEIVSLSSGFRHGVVWLGIWIGWRKLMVGFVETLGGHAEEVTCTKGSGRKELD